MLRQTIRLAFVTLGVSATCFMACSDNPAKPATGGAGGASSSSSDASSSSGIAGMGNGGAGGMGTGGMMTGGMGGTGGSPVDPPPPCNIGTEQRLTIYSNNNLEAISLAWNGTEYAGFYRDVINSKFGIYYSRWSKSGIQLGSAQLIQESPNPSQDANFFATTLWNGAGYGVLWSQQTPSLWSLYFSSYDAQANQLSAPVKIASNSVEGHALTYTGTNYGLAWIAAPKAYFGLVSSSGTMIGTPTELGPATFGNGQSELSVAWSGNEYGVAWTYNAEVYFTRVNADGAEIITEIDVGPSQYDGGPHLVWGKGEYVMTWAADGATSNDGSRVFAQRIAENGTLKGNRIEVKNLGTQTSPVRILPHVDIHYNGTTYAIAWASNEIDPRGTEMYMARFDASMQKIGADIQVTNLGPRDTSNIFAAGNFPRLIWNGEEYAMTWHDYLGKPSAAWNAYLRTACY